MFCSSLPVQTCFLQNIDTATTCMAEDNNAVWEGRALFWVMVSKLENLLMTLMTMTWTLKTFKQIDTMQWVQTNAVHASFYVLAVFYNYFLWASNFTEFQGQTWITIAMKGQKYLAVLLGNRTRHKNRLLFVLYSVMEGFMGSSSKWWRRSYKLAQTNKGDETWQFLIAFKWNWSQQFSI